jgi:hypothetical protein
MFAANQTTALPNVNLPLGQIDAKNEQEVLTKLAHPLRQMLGAEAHGEKENAVADGLARQLAGLNGSFKDAAIRKTTADMNKWSQANPNGTLQDFQKELKRSLSVNCAIQSNFKQNIMQMAQQAIDRMKDTFEG